MLLEDMPSQIARREGLVTQLALDLLPLVEDVLVLLARARLHVQVSLLQLSEDCRIVHRGVAVSGVQGGVVTIAIADDGVGVDNGRSIRVNDRSPAGVYDGSALSVSDDGSSGPIRQKSRAGWESIRVVRVSLDSLKDKNSILLDNLLDLSVWGKLGNTLDIGSFKRPENCLSLSLTLL